MLDEVSQGDGAAIAPAAAETTDPALETEPVVEVGPAATGTYKVKVDGNEYDISVGEALAGYQRQQDYTRKTQALAAEREQLSQAQQLWNAIEANPEHTIGAIADAYGFRLSPAEQAAAEAQQAAMQDDDESSAPADPRWAQVEQFMQQAQNERLQAQIDRQLADLHSKTGLQFDDNQLLLFAAERMIPNLDDAFTVWTSHAAQQVAKDRQIQARKQTSPPVAGGHGVAGGSVNPGPGGPPKSVAEAMALAAQELGVEF